MSTRNATVKMAGPAVVEFLCFKNSMLSAHLPSISSARSSLTKINMNFGGVIDLQHECNRSRILCGLNGSACINSKVFALGFEWICMHK